MFYKISNYLAHNNNIYDEDRPNMCLQFLNSDDFNTINQSSRLANFYSNF